MNKLTIIIAFVLLGRAATCAAQTTNRPVLKLDSYTPRAYRDMEGFYYDKVQFTVSNAVPGTTNLWYFSYLDTNFSGTTLSNWLLYDTVLPTNTVYQETVYVAPNYNPYGFFRIYVP
jgi:hypothetical protein